MNNTLGFLTQIAHGVACQFGTCCEVLIHDLTKEDIESSIVYIENGHVSNRRQGDGPSGIVLEALNRDPAVLHDHLAYLTRTDDGRILKSSTMYIRGDDGRVAYIFSLNYDITGLITVDNAIRSLTQTQDDTDQKPKRITNNVHDLLDALIEQSVELVGKPVALMNKEDKITAIQYLNNAGAFLITKSGDKVSSFFDISKFTLYSYIEAGKQQGNAKQQEPAKQADPAPQHNL